MRFLFFFLLNCSATNTSNLTTSSSAEGEGPGFESFTGDQYRIFYVEDGGQFRGYTSDRSTVLENTLSTRDPGVYIILLPKYGYMTLYGVYLESTNLNELTVAQCIDGYDLNQEQVPQEFRDFFGGVTPVPYGEEFTLPESFTDPTPPERMVEFEACKMWMVTGTPVDPNLSSSLLIKKEGIFFIDETQMKVDIESTVTWRIVE